MNACGGRLTIVSNQRHCRRTLGQTQTGQGLDMLNKGRALNFGQGRQGVGQMGDLGGRWCRVCAGFAPPGSECAIFPGVLGVGSTPLGGIPAVSHVSLEVFGSHAPRLRSIAGWQISNPFPAVLGDFEAMKKSFQALV